MNIWVKRSLIALLVLLLAALAIAFVMGLRFEAQVLREFDEDEALAAGEAYAPTIHRDEWGVPRVIADTDAELAFGFAFAHAEDDFATIQDALRTALGPDMKAEGESEARLAYLIQSLDIVDLSRDEYETQLDADTRALLDGYADGLNYYAALNGSERVDDLFPVTGQDVAALSAFFSPLFFGMSGTLTRLTNPEVERSVSEGQSLQVWYDAAGETELGSNAFAVAPSRSDDGATRLIINSHQPLQGPLAWYEGHYISREGWEFTGGAFPGGPFLHLGGNSQMAQAATVNSPDLIDVYELKMTPDDERYILDGEPQDFETEEAVMLIDLPGPFVWRATRPIERSAHGPVLRLNGKAYALRYATQGSLRALNQTYAMMRTTSVGGYQEALEQGHLGATNRFVADTSGRIARYYNARMPSRIEEAGLDWEEYLPGDRSALIWNSFAPFDQRPHMIDPQAGYVLDANSSPFTVTEGADDPRYEDFPVSFGLETNMTNRALRAVQLFRDDADGKTSREELIAMKYDGEYHPESFAMQMRAQLMTFEFSDEPDLQKGMAIIEAWDGRTNGQNRNAALSLATYQPIGVALFLKQKPPELEDTYREAVAYMMKHHGRLDPPWVDVNRHERGDVSLGLEGGPDTLRAVNSEPDENGSLVMNSGDGLHYLWEAFPDGNVRLWGIHQYGASSRSDSPHYTDQMKLFVDGVYREIPLGEAAVLAASRRSYTPRDMATIR